ncbi:ParB/RepB/Spo0J family partition protein [Legionella pneumophila]|uniref:ParB/RepB/Spo0J family partition protein n=1 Tax=Legionella pneumophila TaxID=446 RepID=UPI001F4D92C9|nr:ParB/RepB/Spo0J family partition protein [Legionella pneumophila]MCH9091634.1 ParB/RepB/Spo0J family partition protein [Legionella pneumophila serogroup 1]
MSIKKKIITSSLTSNKIKKPDTVTRAGITANLKFTRGKQLVEHDPALLIPDPYNPRPGEIIDEHWLRKNLYIGTDKSLCRFSKETGEYIIPEYSQLICEANESLEESYNFLRELAFSIRVDGLIEPIEIFLADRNNDPDYFIHSDLDYGYVILEGHQRRLAAMMADVPTVTCIEITDESMLVKLKVKHRKLRRQLSENNLRKGLTVAQNFLIAQELLSDLSGQSLSNKELSSIIGLNEGIVSALKSICSNPSKYPPLFISMIKDNKLTFKMIRNLVAKTYEEIELALCEESKTSKVSTGKVIKPRGKQGGAVKKYATFKVRDQNESKSMQRFLLSRFPEIEHIDSEEVCLKSRENILNKIKEIALKETV